MRKQSHRTAVYSAFVFASLIVQSLFFLNPKFQAFFRDCTDRFVSDLVGNPKDRFFSRQGSFSRLDTCTSLAGMLKQLLLCYFKTYSERSQIMGKVTEWFFLYFLIFQLVMVAKLKFPTFPQFKSIANCSGQP